MRSNKKTKPSRKSMPLPNLKVVTPPKNAPHSEALDDLELDALGIPLEADAPFPELDQAQRILFQRCCEIYRIADLFHRKRDFMLHIFSEYRTRTHFESVLKTHYFDTDERLTPHFDPEFYTIILGAYHFIRSLSLSLRHTDSLPTMLAQELTWGDANLIKTWNRIAIMAKTKFGWRFKLLIG